MPMTRDQLFQKHQDICESALELMRRKNNDYGGVTDPFANFRRVEALGICKPEVGFMVRMADKMSRLATFVRTGNLMVKDEGVTDTLIDLINYSILLAAYIESQKAEQPDVAETD